MPISQLNPQREFNGNTGIRILPQLGSQPAIDPTDPTNPLNSNSPYPSGPEPVAYPPATGQSVGGGAPRAVPVAQPVTGVGPSSGGWNIDANGNIIPQGSAGGWNIDANGNLIQQNIFQRVAGSLGHTFGSLVHKGLNVLRGGFSGLSSNTIGGLSAADAFNAGRAPFSPTWQQLDNPGSAIGPTSGSNSNPYNPQPGVPAFGFTHPSGIPGYAAANQAILGRHIK